MTIASKDIRAAAAMDGLVVRTPLV